MPEVAMLGFPTDSNSSYLRGSAKAPGYIRAALWNEGANSFSETGIDLKADGILRDFGDVDLAEDEMDRATIEHAVAAQLDAGRSVLSLGGDHSITYPIVKAFARRFPDLRIVHFDAHPDLYPIFNGSRYSHACPFARILEDTGVTQLVQIGIRTMTAVQREVAQRFGVAVYAPWELDHARAALPDGPVYVTVDLDGIDPAFAPGVSHREPGGLSVRDVLETIKCIPGYLVGADVVELNPDKDVDELTATVAAKLTKELVARMCRKAVL
ncbi:MAG: agmatinase [Candidatus Eremiobacteraeota bacterium]|nr:agmatinase [Candidatus Eremiobacteraeota bacterium]